MSRALILMADTHRAVVRRELRFARASGGQTFTWFAEHSWWARQVAERALAGELIDAELEYGYRVTQRLARLEFRAELRPAS